MQYSITSPGFCNEGIGPYPPFLEDREELFHALHIIFNNLNADKTVAMVFTKYRSFKERMQHLNQQLVLYL